MNTSVAIRFHLISPTAGGVGAAGRAAYTARITAEAKQEIRRVLETRYELRHATIYGDYPGFAQFGTPDLPVEPPEG